MIGKSGRKTEINKYPNKRNVRNELHGLALKGVMIPMILHLQTKKTRYGKRFLVSFWIHSD